jgi:hypothetical protein
VALTRRIEGRRDGDVATCGLTRRSDIMILKRSETARSVMNLSRYLAKNTPPEKRAILRAAAAVIIAYTLGVFVIFLLF